MKKQIKVEVTTQSRLIGDTTYEPSDLDTDWARRVLNELLEILTPKQEKRHRLRPATLQAVLSTYFRGIPPKMCLTADFQLNFSLSVSHQLQWATPTLQVSAYWIDTLWPQWISVVDEQGNHCESVYVSDKEPHGMATALIEAISHCMFTREAIYRSITDDFGRTREAIRSLVRVDEEPSNESPPG